jgi:hypothetical protein
MATDLNKSNKPPSALREWRDVLNSPFPPFGDIDEATRETTRLHGQRFRGSVRLSTARFFTTEEYNQLRKEELAKKLP